MSTERFMSKSNSAGFWNRIKTVLFNKSVTDIKISGKTVIITKVMEVKVNKQRRTQSQHMV